MLMLTETKSRVEGGREGERERERERERIRSHAYFTSANSCHPSDFHPHTQLLTSIEVIWQGHNESHSCLNLAYAGEWSPLTVIAI